MTQTIRNVLGLVHESAAHRTGINLDKPDDVGILAAYELRDVIEDAPAAAQVTRTRQRQMKSRTSTGRITDVVDE